MLRMLTCFGILFAFCCLVPSADGQMDPADFKAQKMQQNPTLPGLSKDGQPPVPQGSSPLGPGGDDCSTATAVGDGAHDYDTTTATMDGAHPCGVQGTSGDVWFLYTAPCSGVVTAGTCTDSAGGETEDTVLTLWGTDTCTPTAGQELDCNDDACGAGSGFASEVSGNVVGGNSYLIQVSGFNGGTASGSLTIVTDAAGDECVDASVVGDGDHPFDTSCFAGGPDADMPCSGSEGVDVWFLYTASCTGTLTASTCGQASDDTLLTVWDGSDCAAVTGGTGTALGCNDDACSLQSEVSVAVTIGNTYLVQLAGWGGATPAGTLSLGCVGPPPEDDCTMAIPVGEGDFAYDTEASTGPDAAPSCGLFGGDVWYLYTACGTGTATIETCEGGASGEDSELAVWEADCAAVTGGTGVELGCSGDDCGASPGFASTVSLSVTGGTTYLVQVAGFGASGTAAGTLSITNSATPANDDCADATAVGEGVFDYTTVCASGVVDTPCSGADGSNVWFLYSPSVDGTLTAGTCTDASGDETEDTVLAVWSAGDDCAAVEGGTGTAIGCSDDACGGGSGFASEATATVSAGNSYLISVSGFGGGTATGSLSLSVAPPVFTEPCDLPGVPTFTANVDAATVLPGNSISCNAGGTHTDNGYFRTYPSSDWGSVGIQVEAVEIGIEVSNPGAGFDTQGVVVNIYSDDDADPGAGLVLLGSEAFDIPGFDAAGLHCFELSTPVEVLDTVTNLVVEIFTPDAFFNGKGHSFFIGSNDAGQASASYLAAAPCGAPAPTDIALFGFPDMHIVETVYYTETCEPGTAAFTSAGNPALFGPEPVEVSFDSSGSTGSDLAYSWNFDEDGGNDPDSTDANPTHEFPAGTWDVSLNISNSCSSDTATETDLVTSIAIGDCNADGSITLADVVADGGVLPYLFLAGSTPPCLITCDWLGDGDLNIGDAVQSLNGQFLAGPPPISYLAGAGCALGSGTPAP